MVNDDVSFARLLKASRFNVSMKADNLTPSNILETATKRLIIVYKLVSWNQQ